MKSISYNWISKVLQISVTRNSIDWSAKRIQSTNKPQLPVVVDNQYNCVINIDEQQQQI